jgi:hypothetical protein
VAWLNFVCVFVIFSLFGYLSLLSLSRLYRVDDEMINECGAIGGITIGRGN